GRTAHAPEPGPQASRAQRGETMRNCLRCGGWAAGLTLLVGVLAASAESPAPVKETIRLQRAQKELLSLEPILVTARLESTSIAGLPPGPGKGPLGSLQFEVKPAVKARTGARPLPLEAQVAGGVKVRTYDLLEWYQFPAEGGPYSVRLLFEHDG